MIEWFRRLYWKWYWRKNPKKHLARSAVWETEIKKLLHEDLNSMKFVKTI